MKSRTFARLGLALAMVSALGVTACDDETVPPPPAQTIQMTPQGPVPMEVGQTVTLSVAVGGVTNPQVSFTSSNQNVATVTSTGNQATVTAVGQGTATITATVAGTGLVASTQVIVSGDAPGAITVQVDPPSASIGVNQTVNLFATVRGTSNQNVTWSSRDETVATVDPNTGVVRGVAPGTAVIVATSAEDASARGTATITVTAQQVNVNIAPTNPTIFVGDSLRFSAVVTGTTTTTVTWESSNPSVASIDNNGVARGLSEGSTIITARSTANTNAVASTTLTVERRPGGTTSIATVRTQAGTDVDPNNVTGIIVANVNVDAPAGSPVRVVRLVMQCGENEVEVGRQNVSAGTTGQVSFTFNTAAFDPETGEPRFTNQQCTLRSELLDAQGNVVASGSGLQLRLANPNQLALSVDPARTGIGGDGLTWFGGAITVNAAPVMFSGGTVSSVTICLNQQSTTAGAAPAAGTEVCRTDSTAPFSVTFPTSGANSVAGWTSASVTARATSIAGGAQGPTVQLAAGPNFRLDEVAPTLTLAFSEPQNTLRWLGSDFAFSGIVTSQADPGAATGQGSNAVTTTFHVARVDQLSSFGSTAAAQNAAIVANQPAITTSAELEQTLTEDELIVVARAVDAVGNATITRLGATFGVDLTPPTAQVSQHPTAINPTNNFIVIAQDDRSGPFQMRTTVFRVTNGGLVCVDQDPGTAGCQPIIQSGGTATVNPQTLATNAYYVLETVAVDEAGNVSAPVRSRNGSPFLLDVAAPTATLSSTTVTTTSIQIGGTVTDAADLNAYQGMLRFGAVADLPFNGEVNVSDFGTPIVTSTSASSTFSVIRTLFTADAAGTTFDAGTPVSGAGFGAWDQAFNSSVSGFSSISANQSGAALPADLQRWRIESPPSGTTICGTGTAAACGTGSGAIPSTRQLTARAAGPSGTFPVPFQTVHFFRLDARTGQWMLIGSDTQPDISDTGTGGERRYDYVVTFNAAGLPADPNAEIIAVGIDAQGDAVATNMSYFLDIR